MRILAGVAAFASSRNALVLLAFSLAGYVLLEKAGLFRLEPAGYRETLHSLPARAISVVFLVHAVFALVRCFREKEGIVLKTGAVLLSFSFLLLASALWISFFFRFEGEAVRARGETLDPFRPQYLQSSLYGRAGSTVVPNMSMTFTEIEPAGPAKADKLENLRASVLFADKDGVRPETLHSSWRLFSEWTFITLTDFGYAPRYVLSDLSGRQLEAERVYMRLFPPGAEDRFEAMFLGYLFYVRLYPDFDGNEDAPGSRSLMIREPMYNLRIVRNKDIVYSGLLKPTEKIRFDNGVVSLPEVTMWVRLRIVRDPGLPVAAGGLVLLVLSLLFRIPGILPKSGSTPDGARPDGGSGQ
jgi:hypothetical protein